jgi:hypothetical protein
LPKDVLMGIKTLVLDKDLDLNVVLESIVTKLEVLALIQKLLLVVHQGTLNAPLRY